MAQRRPSRQRLGCARRDMYFFDLEGADAPNSRFRQCPRCRKCAFPDVPHALMSWRSSSLGIETESLGSQLADFCERWRAGARGVEGIQQPRRPVQGRRRDRQSGWREGDHAARDFQPAARHAEQKLPGDVVRNKKELTLNVTLDENGKTGAIGRAARTALVVGAEGEACR